jgi:hypothetical protein
MSYLSSHKNLFLSAAFALLILAIGLVVNKRSEQEPVVAPQNLSKQTTEISTTTSMTDRDSDVDGLPDWEEHLYGSDPLKFDSDGDGTPDGQEVKEGRNPAKASTAKAHPLRSHRNNWIRSSKRCSTLIPLMSNTYIYEF